MRLSCGRRLRLIVVGSFALGVAVVGGSIAAHTATQDLTSLTERLEQLAREKNRVQEKLRTVKRRQRQVTRQLQDLDYRLSRAEYRLHTVSASVATTQAELRKAAEEFEQAEAKLLEQQSCISERLIAIYKRGETSTLEVLLQSSSFSDLANRLYLLNTIISRDAEILHEYDSAHYAAAQRQSELESRHAELISLQTEIEQEKRRTSKEREATKEKKLSILENRSAWEHALAELEQDSSEIETMLQRLGRTPEGRARASKQWNGKFTMPVHGRLSSGYGYRRHPIYKVRKFHTGIDIAAPTGTPIRCAGDGTVVHAARWGGYGNCIIVDHGGSLATLYGHCSRLAVTKGQRVTEGQVIGYVGSTGISTGPHLHFEVRKNGRHTNPNPYLK